MSGGHIFGEELHLLRHAALHDGVVFIEAHGQAPRDRGPLRGPCLPPWLETQRESAGDATATRSTCPSAEVRRGSEQSAATTRLRRGHDACRRKRQRARSQSAGSAAAARAASASIAGGNHWRDSDPVAGCASATTDTSFTNGLQPRHGNHQFSAYAAGVFRCFEPRADEKSVEDRMDHNGRPQ